MIDWNTPKKLRSTEEHNKMFSSEAPAAGSYVPNMSEDDKQAWKGKHINKGGKFNERIEIRKTFSSLTGYAQMLMVIVKDEGVKISANGKIEMTFKELHEFNAVISEALALLK